MRQQKHFRHECSHEEKSKCQDDAGALENVFIYYACALFYLKYIPLWWWKNQHTFRGFILFRFWSDLSHSCLFRFKFSSAECESVSEGPQPGRWRRPWGHKGTVVAPSLSLYQQHSFQISVSATCAKMIHKGNVAPPRRRLLVGCGVRAGSRTITAVTYHHSVWLRQWHSGTPPG